MAGGVGKVDSSSEDFEDAMEDQQQNSSDSGTASPSPSEEDDGENMDQDQEESSEYMSAATNDSNSNRMNTSSSTIKSYSGRYLDEDDDDDDECPSSSPNDNEVEGTSSSMSRSTKARSGNRKRNKPRLTLARTSGRNGNKNRKKETPLVTDQNGKTVKKSKYTFSGYAQEDHKKALFGCKFYQHLAMGEASVFATVGSNRVTIYECPANPEEEGSFRLLQCYADPDTNENFYTCAWSNDDDGKPILAAGGARGFIRIFSPVTASCIKHYASHGASINDLIFHTKDKNLLISASKDHSLRMWNVKTDNLVAIFGGVEGHRDEVIAVDIDLTGSRLVSCGMDHSLKVWNLKCPKVQKIIQKSYTFNQNSRDGKVPFPTRMQHFPDFSTRNIHRNYVDCAKWFGNFIFSKSTENHIICWKGGKIFQDWNDIKFTCEETSVIADLQIEDCENWYVRFALDWRQETLAVGNTAGQIYIYDITAEDPTKIPFVVLTHPKSNVIIRQIAFSRNGRMLIAVCDNATIWRWNISREDDNNNSNNTNM